MIFRVFVHEKHRALKPIQSFPIPLPRIRESSSETTTKNTPQGVFLLYSKNKLEKLLAL